MSFSLADAAPLALMPLDFATLLSLPSLGRPSILAISRNRYLDASSAHCLATVLLDRADWRDAAIALGGRFDAGARQPL